MDTHHTLVINCGSSSLKFAVIQPSSGHCIVSGLAERLGSDQASLTTKQADQKRTETLTDSSHKGAIAAVLSALEQANLLSSLSGVGHRVVHGGEQFSDSILLTPSTLKELQSLSHLAPLHNPVNLMGIEAIMELMPDMPQVAVFDTAFHQTLPASAYLYGLPYEYYEQHGVRRYGFHGSSFRFVSQKAVEVLGKKVEDTHLLVAHLGNGCSACAIRGGESVDTSMGLTPLEGLIMGTRSGDIDPGILPYLSQRLDLSLDEILEKLNKASGLLGLSGKTNDMREIQQLASEGDERATLALEVFAFKIARYLGALAISLPSIDALIFTGGIGENDRLTRSLVIEHLSILGFELDGQLNSQNGNEQGRITTESSTLALVIPTNEELMIALDTHRLVNSLTPRD